MKKESTRFWNGLLSPTNLSTSQWRAPDSEKVSMAYSLKYFTVEREWHSSKRADSWYPSSSQQANIRDMAWPVDGKQEKAMNLRLVAEDWSTWINYIQRKTASQ